MAFKPKAPIDHTQALSKAKIALMNRPDSAFFTTLCFSLKFKWTRDLPTAATNGLDLYFNPDFFMKLDTDERVYVMLHETMHAAYLHITRCQDRERQKWNIAADHVINLQLNDRNFKMPKMGLADPQYKEMSVDQVYDLLPDLPQCPIDMMWDVLKPGERPEDDEDKDGGQGSQGDKEGQGGGGKGLLDGSGRVPGGKSSGPTPEEIEEKMKDIIIRAALQSKMSGDKPGTIPGDIQIYLDGLLKPKLPWYRILAKYLQSYAKNDYSFKRPNRRFFPEHHLPSLYSNNLMDLAVAVDTSGSVTDEDFHQFISETHFILKMMKPAKITLIQFDYTIKAVNEVKSIKELMGVKFSGRGGTSIKEVVDWANEKKPQLLIFFTDGEFYFPEEPFKRDTLWIIHDNPNFKTEWGKVIHYKLNT